MTKRKKTYNPIKQATLLANHRLKNLAVGCIPPAPCELVNLKTQSTFPISQALYDSIYKLRHKWTVHCAVIGIDHQGQPYMKSNELVFKEPYFQYEVAELLNTEHRKIIKGFNQDQLLCAAWIATPYAKNWDEHEAFKTYETLGLCLENGIQQQPSQRPVLNS